MLLEMYPTQAKGGRQLALYQGAGHITCSVAGAPAGPFLLLQQCLMVNLSPRECARAVATIVAAVLGCSARRPAIVPMAIHGTCHATGVTRTSAHQNSLAYDERDAGKGWLCTSTTGLAHDRCSTSHLAQHQIARDGSSKRQAMNKAQACQQ